MFFVHETHTLTGTTEGDFEALYRDEWLPALAKHDGVRLLHFLHHTHGTGPSYTAVTVTGVADGAAWEALAGAIRDGELAPLARAADALRADHAAKVLAPLPFSPLQDLDLAEVPTAATEHEPALFMEDTAWPYPGKFADYLEKAGTLYVETLRKAKEAGMGILELEAAFSPEFGTGRLREIVLWQRVRRPDALLGLLTTEVPPEYRGPGTWMHDALEVRDRWESRLLRSAPWSPLT